MPEEDFANLMLGAGQREIVEHLSGIVAARAGLEEPPLRGFFWRSLKAWQKRHLRPSSDVRLMPPRERTAAAEEIFSFFRAFVSPTLVSAAEKERFSRACDRAFQSYLDKYSGLHTEAHPEPF